MEIKTKPIQDKFNFSIRLGLDSGFDMKPIKPISKIEYAEYNPEMVFNSFVSLWL